MAEQDERASVVIADYLRRRDAGEPINQQQFIASNPELAHELQRYFENEAVIGELNGASSQAAIGETAHAGDAGDSVPVRSEPLKELPTEFGRYRVLRMLGQGAMGAVYLAHDTALDRSVALKTPKLATGGDDPDLVERFEREARAAATLHHRNICPVFDVGEIEGIRYLTMAYIEGKPLAAYIARERQIAERQVMITVRKLAQALEAAHRAGVVHRDLKPANVMVDQSGEPVIMDFGLARKLESHERTRLTQFGTIMGSPAYMSPEQVSGDPDAVGPQSDIYSLGVILFELLSAQLPFAGRIGAVLGQIMTADPPDLEELRPGIDSRLKAICRKMMAKSTDDRYQSMQEVVDDLSDVLRHRVPPASGQQSISLTATDSVISHPEEPDVLAQIAAAEERSSPQGRTGQRPRQASAADGRRSGGSRFGSRPPWQMWTAAGFVGLLLMGGVTILLKGGRVEVEDGSTVKVSQNGEKTTLEITPPGKGIPPETPASEESTGAAPFNEVRKSDQWTWRGPLDFLKTRNDPPGEVLAAHQQLTETGSVCRVYETGNAPHRDLMIISRTDDEEGWSAPLPIGDSINSPGDDASPWISADGLTLIFESDRPGGLGDTDLWVSQRNTLDEPFSQPANLGPHVNSPQTEGLATLSGDGQTLIFASSRTGSNGPSDLWICRRPSVSEEWSPAENLGNPINSNRRDLAPLLTPEGLVLLFTSDRRGGAGGADIWMSQRPSVDAEWSEPVNLGSEVNTPQWDYAPWLSPDGDSLLVNTEGRGQTLFQKVQPAFASNTPAHPNDARSAPQNEGIPTGQWISLMDELRRRAKQVPNVTLTRDGGLEMQWTGFVIDWLPARNAVIRAKVKKLEVGHHPELRLRFLATPGTGADAPGFQWYATFLDSWNRFGLGRMKGQVWNSLNVSNLDRHYDDEFEWTLAAIGDKVTVHVDGKLVHSHRDSSLRDGCAAIFTESKAIFRDVELMVLDDQPHRPVVFEAADSLVDIHRHPGAAIWTRRSTKRGDGRKPTTGQQDAPRDSSTTQPAPN